MTVFQEVKDATRLWIKGDEFTIDRLLGPVGERLASKSAITLFIYLFVFVFIYSFFPFFYLFFLFFF